MNIICLDAEFAIKEVLELSVWGFEFGNPDSKPRQVFHQYFRPREERRWPGSQRVHHISPAMVARKPGFSEWRKRIQQIVDEADVVVGFAIENDIEALEREGITGLADKPCVDVRDLHWLVRTRHDGVELDARKGLAATAGDLGVEFSENLAHGADYDTRITLDCFRRLAAEFELLEFGEGEKPGSEEWLRRYLVRWDEEREAFLKRFAHGWVALQKWGEGYRLKASRMNVPAGSDIEVDIEVNARQRALDEIDAHFDRRRSSRDVHLYNLTAKDVEWFRKYSNEYDGQEPLHRRMAELRAQAARR